ncbi:MULTISPECIES: hypothetical protein [Cyanophyceae]|nr:hypothetical protein [Trichocoleus sp. FACHB-69]MBD1932975.1 hypothetical protein [Trichocoleus sp. FACHB-69]
MISVVITTHLNCSSVFQRQGTLQAIAQIKISRTTVGASPSRRVAAAI